MAYRTDKEIIEERNTRHKRVFNEGNPYGYDINLSNTVLSAWYKRYVAKLNHKDGTEPSVRIAWERSVKTLIARKYKDFYCCELQEPIIGFTRQRVEELVIALGADYAE